MVPKIHTENPNTELELISFFCCVHFFESLQEMVAVLWFVNREL